MTTTYLAARVVDGVSDRPIEDGAVSVDGERIVAVGRRGEVAPGTQTVELGDATLLPGLVDAHVHLVWSASAEPHEVVERESLALTALRTAANARRHLRAGVTTVRDLGSTAGLA